MHKHFSEKWNEGRENCLVTSTPQTQRQFFYRKYYEFIEPYVPFGADVLELGAGRGTIAQYLRMYRGCPVTLVDTEESALNIARRNFDDYKLNGKFICEKAQNLGSHDNSYDVVIAMGLLEHVPDYRVIMKQAYRVLRDGGVFISLNVPHKFSIQTFFQKHKDYHRDEETPKGYKKSAEHIGFIDVKTTYVNPFPLIETSHEEGVTRLYDAIYKIRSAWMPYAFKGSRLLSQGHFLVGRVKKLHGKSDKVSDTKLKNVIKAVKTVRKGKAQKSQDKKKKRTQQKRKDK